MGDRRVGIAVAVLLAVVGTAALISYVRGVEARAAAGQRQVQVLVVDEHVEEGTAAEALGEHVSLQDVPAQVVAAGSVSSLDQLAGQVSTASLEPGEQLLASRFVDPAELAARGQIEVPDGLQQVTISLDAPRALGGNLSAGDTVAVFASLQEGEDGPSTHLILDKVLVTRLQGGVAAAPEPAEGEEDAGPAAAPGEATLVTLAAAAPDVERIVFAAEHGTVWLADDPDSADTDGTRIQHGGTIYR